VVDNGLLRIGEAAARLGVSPQTLRRWAERGLVRTVTLPSGHRRFAVSDIDELAASDANR
jgi:excisionase family DNA binding protein